MTSTDSLFSNHPDDNPLPVAIAEFRIEGTTDNAAVLAAVLRAAADQLSPTKGGVHLHYATGGALPDPESVVTNDGDQPQHFQTLDEVVDELGVDLSENDEATDVSDLPEAPAEEQPVRKRRTKEQLAKAAALEAQGYSAEDVKAYQLRGVPLPALPGEASDENGEEPGEIAEPVAAPEPQAPVEQPVAQPEPQAPVEEAQPATSTEGAEIGWKPQW